MAGRADVRRIAGSRLRGIGPVTTLAGRRLTRGELSLLGMTLEAPKIPPARPATEADAMGLPAYGFGVALIANAIASTEWYARRWNREHQIWERLEQQPAIVTDTYPLSPSQWHYKWAAAEDLINFGNHFGLLGELDDRTGRPGWIIPLPADEMWIITDPARPAWYEWNIGGVSFTADEIFHVPAGNRSGHILGRGAIEQYAHWLPGVAAAEEYAREQFTAGALPPAVLMTNQATTRTQATEIKDKWRELVSKREPIVLPNGTEIKPVVGNAQNAQMVEARQWSAQQTAWILGVPGWKMGLPGATMTYQNVETADIDFTRDCVDRWGRPITDAVTKWLLQRGVDLEWDYDDRLRSDAQGKAKVTKTLIDAGVLEAGTEGRARYNLPPRPERTAPGAAPDAGAGAADAAGAAAAQTAQQQLPEGGIRP